MPKKNPEKEERRELTEFLDSVGVSDVVGVQELFKDHVGAVLENGLEGEFEPQMVKKHQTSLSGDIEDSGQVSLCGYPLSLSRCGVPMSRPQIRQRTSRNPRGPLFCMGRLRAPSLRLFQKLTHGFVSTLFNPLLKLVLCLFIDRCLALRLWCRCLHALPESVNRHPCKLTG